MFRIRRADEMLEVPAFTSPASDMGFRQTAEGTSLGLGGEREVGRRSNSGSVLVGPRSDTYVQTLDFHAIK